MRRPNPATLALILACASLVLAGCLQREYAVDTSHEAGEPGRVALDAAGQANCIAEATRREGTSACPMEPTGGAPPEGILILDDFYTTLGAPHSERSVDAVTLWAEGAKRDPTKPFNEGDVAGPGKDVLGGDNPHRATGGQFPNVILPGVGTFWAGLGWWNDLDRDGNVAVSASTGPEADPTNEFVTVEDARIFSWVDPGSYPTHISFVTPDASMPDFTYHLQYTVYQAGGTASEIIVFLDGSIIQPIRVYTASEPTLTPSDHGLPFTPGPRSRVDIDDYTALAPAPVQEVFADTLADYVNRQGSPSFGWCPGQCGSPFTTGVDPIDDELAGTYDLVHPRYPPEWNDDSGSSAAGRRTEFESGFHGWMDLVAGSRGPGPTAYVQRLPVSQSSLVAPRFSGWSNTDPQLTVGPGWMSFDVWIGVWKDLSRDGFVGDANGDPYAGGNRPGGNDYLRPAGEFIGTWPLEQGTGTSFDVWLVPDTDWGSGAYVFSNIATPQGWGVGNGPTAAPCKSPTLTVGGLCFKNGVQGTDPIRMPAWIDRGYGVDGYYRSQDTVFFPEGSPGFTICTPDFTVRFAAAGILVDDRVYDCDHLARYQGL